MTPPTIDQELELDPISHPAVCWVDTCYAGMIITPNFTIEPCKHCMATGRIEIPFTEVL